VATPLAYALFSLAPALWVGWYGDDAQFSYLASALAARHETLWDAIVAANALWIDANGRLYPLAIAEKYAVFTYVRDPAAYKALLLGLTLACIAAFAALVRAIAGEKVAFLAACFGAAAFSLRAYHDANLAYNGMLQLVFLATVASLAAWRRAVLARDPLAALAAVVLYAASGLTYEVAYLFFPLYACVVRPARSWPRAVAATWPFALTTLALGGVSAWLRSRVEFAPGSDYRAGTQAAAYAATFVKQFVAGIPLTYEFFDPQRLFPSLQKIATLDAGPYAFRIPVALAFAVLAFVLLGRDRGASPHGGSHLGAAAALGVGLAVLPVPLVAASGKYQRELAWGLGYLPVFMQTFGIALSLAVAVRAARLPRALVALGLFLIADLTSGTNAIVGEALHTETTSRAVVERAFARGLARDVPPGATIVLPSDLSWVCEDPLCPDGLTPAYLIYGATGRRYATAAPEDRAYAGASAFRLRYAAVPGAETVTLERGGAAASSARYRETASGAWTLARR
jgi:hypothetical protein